MTATQTATQTNFDPSRYLSKVGAADYLEVKWRLVWLREVYPDAVIETECLHYYPPDTDPDGNMVGSAAFKATVSLPSGGKATGHGSESVNDFREYYEKAETKAIGRALAALGFGTQFSTDHEFSAAAVGGHVKIVDSSVDLGARAESRPNGNNPQPSIRGGMVTANQKKFIGDLLVKYGESPAEFEDRINTLTFAQASDWLTKLQKGELPWLASSPK